MTAPTNPTEEMVANAQQDNEPTTTEEVKSEETAKPEDNASELEKLKADLAAKDESLKKANDERERLKRRKKELEEQINGPAPDLTEALSPWKSALVKTQLTAKGLTPEAADIISRLIKLDEIDITDEGIAGLNQIDELEKTMPQLFAKPAAPVDETKPGHTPAATRPIDTGNPQSTNAGAASVLSDASKQMLKGLKG